MNTETYNNKVIEASNALESARNAEKRAEKDIEELYNSRAKELTEQYADLVGKKVECCGVVGYFRGFMDFHNACGYYSENYIKEFFPMVMKPKKNGEEGKAMFSKWSVKKTTSPNFYIKPVSE